MLLLLLMSVFALVASDVSHLQDQKDYHSKLPARPEAFTDTADHADGPYTGSVDREGGSDSRTIEAGAIVDSTAFVDRTARVQAGAIVQAYAVVLEYADVGGGAIMEPYTTAGRHSVVGGGAIMQRGSRLRDYSRLAPGQILPAGAVH